jgi:hypothetical protein
LFVEAAIAEYEKTAAASWVTVINN